MEEWLSVKYYAKLSQRKCKNITKNVPSPSKLEAVENMDPSQLGGSVSSRVMEVRPSLHACYSAQISPLAPPYHLPFAYAPPNIHSAPSSGAW